jgi:hypothetical protein
MKYKAICSDIDGTLLNSIRDLSPRLIEVVNRFSENFPVILASSRMPDAIRHLVTDLRKQPQPLIAYNGGFVLSSAGEILEDVSIPVALVEKILHLTEKSEIHVSLYQGEDWYEEKDDYWSQREVKNTKVECTWMKGFDVVDQWAGGNSGAHKVMCMGNCNEINWLFRELHLEHAKDLHLYRSSDTYLEIAPKAVSKATGLKKILNHEFDFDMDAVIAFGDNYNDIDLLQSVGWGVAVANARSEVKAIAQEITFTNKEDGVAMVLEKILLQV